MRALFVHGVNRDRDDNPAGLVERELRLAGLDVDVDDGCWRSTGSFTGDVAAFASRLFRDEALSRVGAALASFKSSGGGVVLAHSMGTVLVLQCEHFLRTGLPIICMASPLSNPAFLPALHLVGLGEPPPSPVLHLWNDDDPIPGGQFADQPSYFQAVRIAVADNEARQLFTEHDLRGYVRHPITQDALRLAWSRLV